MRVTGHALQNDVADAMGVDQSSVSRWRKGSRPSYEMAVALARAYSRSPIEALIAAGYVDAAELDLPIEVNSSLTDISADALLAEVARRLAVVGEDRKRSGAG